MNKLEYHFKCLEGFYELFVEYDNDRLLYEINTDIESLESINGELDSSKIKQFVELLDKAEIGKWDKEYEADGSIIEDGTTWSIAYLKDDKEYHSKGVEGYWPYGYEYFIEALKLIDAKADYMNIDGGNR